MNMRAMGATGEDMALQYLLTLGWKLLDRNVHLRTTELDLVMEDPEGVVVAVEVKYRSSTRSYGHPLESLTDTKRKRITQGLLQYATEQDIPESMGLRVDALILTDQELWHYPDVGLA